MKGENGPTRARIGEIKWFLVGGGLRLKKGDTIMSQPQITHLLARPFTSSEQIHLTFMPFS